MALTKKRAVLIFPAVVFGCYVCRAQGIKEWFSQKQTQTQYLIQQVAALKVYTGYLEKGYKIVQGGLNTIGNIKDGHFKLDQVFFEGLKAINPRVKNYSRVADIIQLNIQAINLSDKALKEARESVLFKSQELSYAESVFGKILDDCSELTDELITILTPGELGLSDDERIKRIDGVYIKIRDRYRFENGFYADLHSLRLQRGKELRETKVVQKMYEQ